MNADLCAKKRMGTSNKRRPVVPEPLRGYFFLPADGAEIRLNPTEASLFRLFLAHPEGLTQAKRNELGLIYFLPNSLEIGVLLNKNEH